MSTLKTDISNERAWIHHGPHTGIIAIVYTLLFIGGIAASIYNDTWRSLSNSLWSS